MLCVWAGLSVLGSSPGRGGGGGKTRGSTVVTGYGDAWKGPWPGQWGGSYTLLLPALISGPVHGSEGAGENLIYVRGRDTSLAGLSCGLWQAVGENHPEAACWLHSGPKQRP